jgi:hypothetical protein
MTALAYRVTDAWSGRSYWQSSGGAHRSTDTATWLRVRQPPPSEAADTTNIHSPVRTVEPTWSAQVVKRLNHLLQLQDGWAGPGTLGVEIDVVLKAIEILSRVATEKTRPPSISPGEDGSLQLAWYARKFELEIDVPRAGDVTASLYDHDSQQESELTLTSPQLRAAIEGLATD